MTKGRSHRKTKNATADRELKVTLTMCQKGSRVFLISKMLSFWLHQYFFTCNLLQCNHSNKTFDLIHLKVYVFKSALEILSWERSPYIVGLLPLFFKKEKKYQKPAVPYTSPTYPISLLPPTATYNI